MNKRSSNIRRAIVVGFAAMVMAGSHAQTFPDKPITIIVPYIAGTLADIMSRSIGIEMTALLKQPVVIENRPGAGEVVAATVLSSAAPNGHTLMITLTPNVVSPSVQARLPYKSIGDFAAVSKVVSLAGVLAVGAHVPASNLKEFLSLLKSQPNRFTFGSAGVGSAMQLSGELFGKMTETRSVHVPYKGFQPVMNDMVGGLVDFAFPPVNLALQFAKDGKIKVFGAQTLKRYPDHPEIPTLDEQGIKGYESKVSYYFVTAKGTPAPIVEALNKAIAAAISTEAFANRMLAIGGVQIANPSTPAETAAALVQEEARWRGLVKELNIALE